MIKELMGVMLESVAVNEDQDEIIFTAVDGRVWMMNHYQDCCESVSIDDIIGDLADLVGSEILMAEEVSHSDSDMFGLPLVEEHWGNDSCTWTFYKLATVKGYVTIRWYGSSNGYYSESVNFGEVN